ncbi:MAG: ribulose 1,5-bisphosphate carboxylase, partial [Phyllobacteriaceae bacterium]|nr:ribulose 1,5-bisphosphate carboxylase [Phyllobacteriaceae bacterium]
YERTGRTVDLMYLCGGGIVSHPGGAGAGVRAVKQSWEAAVLGVSLVDYAKDHPELAQSIATFANGKGA